MNAAVIRPDPAAGLAAERTVLAWRRTAVSSMANVILLLRAALDADGGATLIVPLVGVVALLTVAVTAIRRSHDLHGPGHRGIRDSHRAVGVVAAAVGGVGLSALILVAALA